MYIDNKMDSLTSLKSIKRHYKKDSRYVNDLYTLTYDNHESLDTVELISSLYFRTDITDDVSMICLTLGEREREKKGKVLMLFCFHKHHSNGRKIQIFGVHAVFGFLFYLPLSDCIEHLIV
jgi:hypothetical protein